MDEKEKYYMTYIKMLYKQFCEAKEIKHDGNLSSEFVNWIAKNSLLCKQYREYLRYLHVCIDEESIIEIDKGRYDSISVSSSNIVPITRYGRTLGVENSSFTLITNASNGMVVPVYLNSCNQVILPVEQIILTHNPFEILSIREWFKIHNQGQYDISIGMYGEMTDKNIENKLRLLEDMSKDMTGEYTLDYDTDNGKYFASLNSRRKVKTKILIR